MNKKAEIRKNYYLLGWVILCLLAVGIIILEIVPVHLNGAGCVLFNFTGVYCPGCGGTRAFFALFMGHPLLSLYFHPLILYVMLLFIWYMISNTIEYLSKGKVKIGSHYHHWYVYAALAIIGIHWIRINIFWLAFQVPLG